ncbi:hypothetical protein IGI37_000504 [Enterococcus sp. AZ194]|uniref:folate family ECF transporter S component n=1 Tax=Enterococcus sp. AZ194 TaxID=2774629 RepID=UPI003F2636C3
MKKLFDLSLLSNPRVLSFSAILIALNVVLNMFNVDFGRTIQVSFAFLAIVINGYFFGPAIAGCSAIIGDVLGFILNPSGFFFPGFTFSAYVSGLLYGVGFHKKPITLKRVIIVMIIKTIIFSFILTPLWLKMMYGTSLFAVPRAIKAIAMFPIETTLVMVSLKISERVKARNNVIVE